jgi:hypothetical protein
MVTQSPAEARCPYCLQPIGGSERRNIAKAEAEHLERKERSIRAELDANYKSQLDIQTAELDQARRAAEASAEEAERHLIEMKQAADQRVADEVARVVNAQESQLQLAQRRILELQRQLDERPSYLRGGLQEEHLVEMLRREFPRDRVQRISGRAGADIEHEVLHEGLRCGIILYESKNVQNWNSDFIDKLNKDKLDSGASYAVLVSTAFPAKAKDLHIVDGIAVVKPELMLGLVSIVRQSLVDLQLQSLSSQDRGYKLEQLLTYFQSPEFKNQIQNVFRAINELEDLQTKERRAHDRHWEEQGRLHKAIKNSSTDIHDAITGTLAGR